MTLDFSRCRLVPLADGTMSGVKAGVKIGVHALCANPYFFLTDEMGAMKSAQVIIAAQFLFEAGAIDKVLVIAPASVRGVWFDPELGELRKHLWTEIPAVVQEFHARVRTWEWLAHPTNRKPLHWMVTNYEFLVSKNRLIQLLPFCTMKTLLVLDESAYIKSYDSARTKACKQLREHCGRVVLLNGTPIAHSPMDLFSQGNMLHPSVHGFKYITHFKSRHAVEQPLGNMKTAYGRPIMKIAGWRDLDELTAKFAPYTLRRLKKDCLDLPEALPPVSYEVPLTEATWKIYREMRDEMVVWLKSGDVAVSKTAAIRAMRLSQITSGFLGGIEASGLEDACIDASDSGGGVPADFAGIATLDRTSMDSGGGGARAAVGSNSIQPIGREKLDFVLGLHREWLDADPTLKLIVWCRFRAELARMMQSEALRKHAEDCASQGAIGGQGLEFIPCNCGAPQIGQIHGGQKRIEREVVLRLLDPRTAPTGPVFFGGTYGTGALGINLTACHTVINMSFDYSLWKAQQTAARVGRPGQTHAVSYFDIVATGPKGQKTVDHAIIKARREREDVALWTTNAWLDALEVE